MYGAQKRVWNTLRRLKSGVNELVQIDTISVEEWTSYFQQLYIEGRQNANTDIEEINDEAVRLMTRKEIQNAINKLKNRKAPGEDDIANELIKYGGEILQEELLKLFNKIMIQQSVPEEWKKSITIPLFKKGSKSIPSNYRGITLLSSVMKLFTRIIADIISDKILINEQQQGFRKNRSTIDAIYVLRQIAEKALEYNIPAYICFVDLTKAFDKVMLQDIIQILLRKDIPKNIIKIIQKLNMNTSTKIKTHTKITREIPTNSGIRQGDSLSPLLFNLIMELLINAVLEREEGYRLGNQKIKIICYADDAAIIAESEDDLQRLVYAFEQMAAATNMEISVTKTKCMTISRQPLRCKIAINNKPIEQVMFLTT